MNMPKCLLELFTWIFIGNLNSTCSDLNHLHKSLSPMNTETSTAGLMLDLIPVLLNGTSVLLVAQAGTQLIMFVPPSLFIILFILFILYFHHHIFIKTSLLWLLVAFGSADPLQSPEQALSESCHNSWSGTHILSLVPHLSLFPDASF